MINSHKLKYTLIGILYLFFLTCFQANVVLIFLWEWILMHYFKWPRVTIHICKKSKISFNKLTICFGYKCIECFIIFFSWLERVLCLERLYVCEGPIWKLDTLKAQVFICLCVFFSFFSLNYSAWYCQEVYVCKNCMRAMNCALRNLEWSVLLMLYLEEWWVKYKSTCFLSRYGLSIILRQWRLWPDEMPCKISCNC
jgi:hypothetical protein